VSILEWSSDVGFFARFRPPPEIQERKNQASELKSEIRQISGILSGLKATLETATRLFKKWFEAEVSSPKIDDRWRYRSLALDGVKRECDNKLAEERITRVQARKIENLSLYRESEVIRTVRIEQELQGQKSRAGEWKQQVEVAQPASDTSDPGDYFDDTPSIGV